MKRFLWMAAIVFAGITVMLDVHSVGIDFQTFYAVGSLNQPYSQQAQDQAVPYTGGRLYYFHPPQELLFYRPLSRLPEYPAFLIWTTLMLACIVASVWLLRREYDTPLVAYLALPFVMASLAVGQDSPIILLLSVLAFMAFKREQDFVAGLILAGILIKPQFTVPLILVIGIRHWKATAGFALGAVLFALQAVWMVGVQGIREMLALGRIESGYELLVRNSNLHGLIGDHTAIVIPLSIALVVWGAQLKSARTHLFCVGILITQLVSYHGHICDMLPLMIPIAVFGSLWLVAVFAALFPLMVPIHPQPYCLFVLPAVLMLFTSQLHPSTEPLLSPSGSR